MAVCGLCFYHYLAALSGVSKELQEAAIVDGANRVKRILHVDIPAILPTIIIMLIFNCARHSEYRS